MFVSSVSNLRLSPPVANSVAKCVALTSFLICFNTCIVVIVETTWQPEMVYYYNNGFKQELYFIL